MATFFSILKALPALIALIRQVLAFVEFANDKVDSAKKAKDLNKGIEHANKTKDTSKLEDIFK